VTVRIKYGGWWSPIVIFRGRTSGGKYLGANVIHSTERDTSGAITPASSTDNAAVIMHSCAAAERQRIAAGAVLRKGLEGHARTWGRAPELLRTAPTGAPL